MPDLASILLALCVQLAVVRPPATMLDRLPDIILHGKPEWEGEPIPFDEPDCVAIDPLGRIWVEDFWRGGVQEFDATGTKRAFSCACEPPDWQRDKGGVPDAVGQHRFPAGPEWLVQSWLGPASDGLHWRHDQERVLLVDSEGHIMRALGTLTNGVSVPWAWWTNQAADGSFACLSSMEDRRTPRLVRVFERNGNLRVMFAVPEHTRPSGLAWSGSRLATALDCQVLVFDQQGRLIADQELDSRASEPPWPADLPWTWLVDFGPDGNEIWLRRGRRAITISRYRLD